MGLFNFDTTELFAHLREQGRTVTGQPIETGDDTAPSPVTGTSPVGGSVDIWASAPINEADNVIGIQNAVLVTAAVNASDVSVSLTATIFDTSSRGDSARILLTNSTGATASIIGASIRGKLVYKRRPPHGGWVHDGHVDTDDIRKNGEKRFSLIGDYIISADQVNKLADYYWKFFRGNGGSVKHIYTLALPGLYAWFEPGNWYTFQLGGAGQSENINSKVELLSVSGKISARGIGASTIVFREVEQSWTATSNAVARFFASGKALAVSRSLVTVASSTYVGQADYFCDGTADDVEIQAAIDLVTESGGVVELTQGTYTIAAKVSLKDNVTLQGRGEGTVLSRNGNLIMLEAASGVDGVTMADFKITANDSNDETLIKITSADRMTIRNVEVNVFPAEFIEGSLCDDLLIAGCKIVDPIQNADGNDAIDLNNCEGLITTCSFRATAEISFTATVRLISAVGCDNLLVADCYFHAFDNIGTGILQCVLVSGDSTRVERCRISNMFAYSDTGTVEGIDVQGDFAKITNNSIQDCGNFDDGPQQAAIGILGDNVQCGGNIIENVGMRGVIVVATSNRVFLTTNLAADCGQLMEHGSCEHATLEPMITGESVPVLSNATFARSSTEAYKGTYSYKHTITTGGASDANVYLVDSTATNDLHGMLAGVEYTFSAWVYVPTTGGPSALAEVFMFIDDHDGATGESTQSGVPVSFDTWQELTVTRTLRGGATGAQIRFVIDDPAASGEFVYWDNVRLFATDYQNDHSNLRNDGGTATKESGNSWN